MDSFSSQVQNIASTYGTDTIFILGKGPSVDRVRKEILANSLVIGINDAERITPLDISIFHDDWVKKSLSADGYRSRLYITSTDFRPSRGAVIQAPFIPMAADMADLMMQRLLSDEFAIEEVLFLSALKIARLVAGMRGKRQKVYMVGFDFSAELGYAQTFERDFADSSADQRSARISPQEFYFLNTLYMLRDSDIDVIHVGDRSFSSLSPEEFNEEFLPSQKAVLPHQSGSSVLVVAELTTNHFGDRHRLERMIRASKAAGADFIKLQKRDVESFYSAEQLASPFVSPFGKTFRDYRHALELDADGFAFVQQVCSEVGIGWFASILDEASFRFIQDFNPTMVKLPSTISEHTDYLSHVAKTYKGDIVLSTGMTDEAYERWVIDTFTECRNLYLLQCNSAYPTPLHDASVAVVRRYRDLAKNYPKIIPGYSSHDFGWVASALAVAAGAQMLEKHVKLGNTEWAHFDAVAVDLTTPAFKDYVDHIREAEMILGSEEKRVNSSEHHKYFRKTAASA